MTGSADPAGPADPADRAAGPDDGLVAASTTRARRRPPPARLSPEAIAAARGGVREGLAWLGRVPEARASLLYRAIRLLVRFACFGVFRLHIATSGQEHIPSGGYLLVAGAHRGWMDPFVVMHALPVEPRAWILGSGPSTFTAPWREWLAKRVGGLLPVWRGGVGIDQHVASARAVVGNGAVFVQMPEGTVSGPPGRLGPMRTGWAIIALRTDVPIVPFAMAGTEELYIGRRMASQVLPPTSARELANLPPGAPVPEPGSRAELDLARAMTDRLAARLGPAVEALYPGTMDPPDRPRRLRARLTWLLMARGRLDRDA
ncbi:MAG TPA: lysophospholipid acyltransferase family protein [Candidatus Limnocylindrales bacterium]|nr:lysophospholipid acyltransferase family protein [Candidatus Limnocylindrales bacterium]